MITDIEAYFEKGCGRCARFATPQCSAHRWSEGLRLLRDLCLGAGLSEHVKWGHPCYMHAGRNITIFGAFREDFRLSFFEAALLNDPEGVLERQGPNTAHPDCLRFTDASHVNGRAEVIGALVAQAMQHAEAGRRAPKPDHAMDLPGELIEALDADPALAEAFHALTPGRQKGYAINLNGAKQSETRIARIERFRDRIMAGKGVTER